MIKLGVPSKGRLQEKTFQVFEAVGLKISKSGSDRTYQTDVSGIENIQVHLMQAGEIPAQLNSGDLHLGVTGEDLVQETVPDWQTKIGVVRALGFGRADMVVAVANCWIDVTCMADLDDIALQFRDIYNRPLRVATKYHTLTRQFFNQHGIQNYRIVDSQGATEGTIASHTADVIVDITSSGSTLQANNLKILNDGVIMRSQACLLASLTAGWSEQDEWTFQNLQDRFHMQELGQKYCCISAKFAHVPEHIQALAMCQVVDNWVYARALKSDLQDTLAALKEGGAEYIDVSDVGMAHKRKIVPNIDIL